MTTERYVYGPFEHGAPRDFSRAHLEFYGINHFRPTFIAQVFFNDPKVTAKNANGDRKTYAGCIAMLGHDECFGDEGHCEIPTHAPRRFDDRPSHPLTRGYRRLVCTDALKRAAKKGKNLTITVIVTSREPFEPSGEHAQHHPQNLFDITGMQLVTYS